MTERILIIIGYLSAAILVGIVEFWAIWTVCEAYMDWQTEKRHKKQEAGE